MVEITFNNKIDNPSLQIGDVAYSVNPNASGFANNPILIGEITNIEDKKIVIANNVSSPAINDFIMFSKNTSVNNSSLLGYYAEVKLTNTRTDKIELFSIGSEVTQSSK